MAADNPAAHQEHTTSGGIPAPVSESYCVPYVAQFIIDQKVLTLSSGKFTIHDSQGTLLFDVKSKIHPVHSKRILRDPSGKAIALMKRKVLTMHDRWAAYRGEDDSDSNLLFTMCKTSVFQFTPSFDVFLANNHSEMPDFKVRGDFFEHSFAILYGNTPVAEARKKMNAASIVIGKDQYGVTVYPGVDHAFIAAIIVIIDQLGGNQFQRRPTALAQLGSYFDQPPLSVEGRHENQDGGCIMTTVGQTGRDDSKNVLATAIPTCDQLHNSKSAAELSLEKARSLQRAFLIRSSSFKIGVVARNSLCRVEPDPDKTSRSLPAVGSTSSLLKPQENVSLQVRNVGNLQDASVFQNWTVVENWRPCSISMIPSHGHWTGIITSLELRRRIFGDVSMEDDPVTNTAKLVYKDSAAGPVGLLEHLPSKTVNNGDRDVARTVKKPRSGLHARFDECSRAEHNKGVKKFVQDVARVHMLKSNEKS